MVRFEFIRMFKEEIARNDRDLPFGSGQAMVPDRQYRLLHGTICRLLHQRVHIDDPLNRHQIGLSAYR